MSPVRPVRFFVTHVVAVCLIAGSVAVQDAVPEAAQEGDAS